MAEDQGITVVQQFTVRILLDKYAIYIPSRDLFLEAKI